MSTPADMVHTDLETSPTVVVPEYDTSSGLVTASPVATSPPWRSVFRFTNSSTKKLAGDRNISSLTLDTNATLVNGSRSPPSQPSSSVSYMDHRSSYNSSNTQSSDASAHGAVRPPAMSTAAYSQPHLVQESSLDAPSTTPSTSTPEKPRTKAGKRRLSGKGQVQTAQASQTTFPLPPPSPHRTGSGLSPKAIHASATRFIRRVASAPNAKGLFSSGSKSPSTMTKNGLLAPSELSAVPMMSSTSADTLVDTSSSSQFSGSLGKATRGRKQSARVPGATANLNLDEAERIAFRRTYSSNSIKVRSVSSNLYGILMIQSVNILCEY
jgi:protein-serine/threonine kinase